MAAAAVSILASQSPAVQMEGGERKSKQEEE